MTMERSNENDNIDIQATLSQNCMELPHLKGVGAASLGPLKKHLPGQSECHVSGICVESAKPLGIPPVGPLRFPQTCGTFSFPNLFQVIITVIDCTLLVAAKQQTAWPRPLIQNAKWLATCATNPAPPPLRCTPGFCNVYNFNKKN